MVAYALSKLLGYMLAQIMGAIVAAAIVLFIASGGPNGYNAAAGGLAANGYGVHSPGHYSLLVAFVAEIVLYDYVCDHCAWRHRREIAGRFCRLFGNRIDAYVSAPCRDSGRRTRQSIQAVASGRPSWSGDGLCINLVAAVYFRSINCRCYLRGSQTLRRVDHDAAGGRRFMRRAGRKAKTAEGLRLSFFFF